MNKKNSLSLRKEIGNETFDALQSARLSYASSKSPISILISSIELSYLMHNNKLLNNSITNKNAVAVKFITDIYNLFTERKYIEQLDNFKNFKELNFLERRKHAEGIELHSNFSSKINSGLHNLIYSILSIEEKTPSDDLLSMLVFSHVLPSNWLIYQISESTSAIPFIRDTFIIDTLINLLKNKYSKIEELINSEVESHRVSRRLFCLSQTNMACSL